MRGKLRWTWLIPVLLLALAGVLLSSRLSPPLPLNADSASLGLLLLDAEEGVCILAVSDGSPADYAGLLPGDYILAADDTPLESSTALNEQLLMGGTELLLTIRRDAQELRLTLPCR